MTLPTLCTTSVTTSEVLLHILLKLATPGSNMAVTPAACREGRGGAALGRVGGRGGR